VEEEGVSIDILFAGRRIFAIAIAITSTIT
jgi:hypothetical protein